MSAMGSKCGILTMPHAILSQASGDRSPDPTGRFVWKPYTTRRPVRHSAAYDPGTMRNVHSARSHRAGRSALMIPAQ